MASQEEPVDEKEGYRPEVIQWWNSGEHMFPPPYAASPAMDERLIHRYFSEMPFFDHASKNGLLLDQSMSNRDLFNITHDRHRFEDHLRRGKGIEYLITGAPQQVEGAPPGTSSGIYNVRKQDRLSRTDARGNEKEVLEVLGSYYFVGERVYQAPSMADVIENRMLSATTELSKYVKKINSLAFFSPAEGYSYLPADANRPFAASPSTGSPSQSRAGSVVPGADPQSLRSASVAPNGAQSDNLGKMRILEESFAMAIQFGDEFIDENPLQGEPGSFTFSASTAAVKKRKLEEEAAVAKAKKEREAGATLNSHAGSPTPAPTSVLAAAPPAVMTTTKAATAATAKEKERAEKKKRRKSRPVGATPSFTA